MAPSFSEWFIPEQRSGTHKRVLAVKLISCWFDAVTIQLKHKFVAGFRIISSWYEPNLWECTLYQGNCENERV